MTQLFKPDKSVTYQVKVQNVYVRSVFVSLKDIGFTEDVNRAKHMNQAELDFVLSWFPDAEIRKFNVTLDREW